MIPQYDTLVAAANATHFGDLFPSTFGPGEVAEYMTGRKAAAAASFYSGADLSGASRAGKSSEHVVPQSWMKFAAIVHHSEHIHDDPINLVVVSTQEQKQRFNKPLRFGQDGHQAMTDGASYAPVGFNADRQGAAARILCYMVLTYPLLTDQPNLQPFARSADAYDRADFDAARPKTEIHAYSNSFASILDRMNTPPSAEELGHAREIYSKFAWCNPLVFSAATRLKLATEGEMLNTLFWNRLRGMDYGSWAVISALAERRCLSA